MEYEGAIYHEMDRGNRRWADRKHRISGVSGKMAFRQVLSSKSSHHLTRNSERILPWAGDYPEWNAKDRRSGARIVPKNFRPDRLACALQRKRKSVVDCLDIAQTSAHMVLLFVFHNSKAIDNKKFGGEGSRTLGRP